MPSRKTATPERLEDQILRGVTSGGGVRSFGAQTVRVTEEARSDALWCIVSPA
jgi:hypothetical protein